MADRFNETVPSYADLTAFQTRLAAVSGHDDERIDQGYERLKEMGFYWVVVRVKAQLFRQPEPHGTLRIETWAKPPETAAIERCYEINDAAGRLAVARMKWVLVRVSDGHPVRLRMIPGLLEARTFSAEDTLADGYAPVHDFTDVPAVTLLVDPGGIDRNSHLNNAHFWRIVTTGARLAGMMPPMIGVCEIAYLKPLYASETVRVYYQNSGSSIEFSGRVKRDDDWIVAFAGGYSRQ
ncbi:MAG: acyl-ACP thioesterase domain-containing protein [bacterium]